MRKDFESFTPVAARSCICFVSSSARVVRPSSV
jgi:hypothetical protein